MLQFLSPQQTPKWNALRNGFSFGLRASTAEPLEASIHPASLAVTKGILVSFYYYAALSDMFKFSAYPRLSWCAFLYINLRDFFFLKSAFQNYYRIFSKLLETKKNEIIKFHAKIFGIESKAQKIYTYVHIFGFESRYT